MDPHVQPTTDIFLDEPITYGTFWERLGAYIIDNVILVIATLLVQFIVNDIAGAIVSVVLGWLYFALQESGPQQATIGKKAVALKVTTTDGQRISFGQATGRYFGKIISSAILLIGYLMVLWDDKRQALHDKMAGTLVIKSHV